MRVERVVVDITPSRYGSYVGTLVRVLGPDPQS
jgi:hypothetical protein